jgi:hypothetical protein
MVGKLLASCVTTDFIKKDLAPWTYILNYLNAKVGVDISSLELWL